MALADIALRGLYNRLLGRFEAVVQTVTSLASETASLGYETFATRAAFFASSGDFQFAWVNNGTGSDGVASLWVKADSAPPTANSSDVQTINGHKFIQIYVREAI